MIDKSYIVYLHINKFNQHTYVGITKQDVKRRWKNGYGYDKCLKFYNAILKYGWDTFEHIILCKASKENAMFLEAVLIAYYKRKRVSYNITDGGEENIPSMLGKHHTDETKELLRNRVFSQETKDKMRKNHYCVKGSQNPSAKAVLQLSVDGEIIKKYDYASLAAEELSIDLSSIIKCCRGKKKTCGGFRWEYQIN